MAAKHYVVQKFLAPLETPEVSCVIGYTNMKRALDLWFHQEVLRSGLDEKAALWKCMFSFSILWTWPFSSELKLMAAVQSPVQRVLPWAMNILWTWRPWHKRSIYSCSMCCTSSFYIYIYIKKEYNFTSIGTSTVIHNNKHCWSQCQVLGTEILLVQGLAFDKQNMHTSHQNSHNLNRELNKDLN